MLGTGESFRGSKLHVADKVCLLCGGGWGVGLYKYGKPDNVP